MSAIQSHTITEVEDSLNFPPQPRLTQMNARPDNMSRQQGIPQLPHQMLSLNPPFLPPQQQQQQHINLLPNAANSNQPMGLIGTAPPTNNAMMRYQMQMQQAGMQQVSPRRLFFQHSQQAQGLNQSTPPSGSHIGLGHFPGGMIQQAGSVPGRRVSSQPQSLNQSPGHLAGGGGGMTMGMNAQTSLPGQLRQIAQQQANARAQHQQLQGQMSPEMAVALSRPGNANVSQNIGRASSAQAQLLPNIAHPPALTQAHPSGLQSSHHQNSSQNAVPLSHQQPQISPSPRPGSHPQIHTPSNMPQASNRTHLASDDPIFIGFQNPQYQQAHHRMPGNAGQFSFVPSTPPTTQHSDAPQSITGGLANPPGPSSRGGFQLTPAQQFEQMQQASDNYGAHLKIHSSSPRPIPPNSHLPSGTLPPQQQQPQHHHSPHPQDPMGHIAQPQRPQSQPTLLPGRPSSQPGPSHTPHATQSQLPTNNLPTGRIPSLPQQQHGNSQTLHQPQVSASGHTASRPSLSAASGSSTTVSSTLPLSEGGPIQHSRFSMPVGFGQGVTRLLQFSGMLASENKTKLQLAHWNDLVAEYFTPKAVMKFTLWKDNERNEAKPFEIGVPILPRFFLVTTQSGVKSMTLSLDGARERLFAAGHAVVECMAAVWTYKYSNGYTVTLRGPLIAHVVVCPQNPPANASMPQTTPQLPYSLKFENLQFDANWHDKYIALESIMGQRVMESPRTPRIRNAPTPTVNGSIAQQRDDDKKWDEPRVVIDRASIPGEPVNAFGIPQATMRCLELAESVGQMADLISFSNDTGLGPIEALTMFASKIRDIHSLNASQGGGTLSTSMNAAGHNFVNGLTASPAVTLYSTAPPSNSSSGSQTAPSINSPQTRPHSTDNSPQKQHKTLPQQSQSLAPTSAALPTSTATAPGSSSTPSTSNATLKRKQSSDTASPTTANTEQAPPAKRMTRKRGRGG